MSFNVPYGTEFNFFSSVQVFEVFALFVLVGRDFNVHSFICVSVGVVIIIII
jgi:hypothetical protein